MACLLGIVEVNSLGCLIESIHPKVKLSDVVFDILNLRC